MGFVTKAKQSQRNRRKKNKQAQQQAIKTEEPEPIQEHRLHEDNNAEPSSTEGTLPREQLVIKTESIEIFEELPPPEECTETHLIPETPFCCLCLRICPPDQFVQFAPQQSLNCMDVAEVQVQLAKVLGLQIDLGELRALCQSCWTLTELLADFRACCWKAAEWRERFSGGITTRDTFRQGWLKRAGVAKMRVTILDHMERIEQAVIEARNERELEQFVSLDEDSFQDGLESIVDVLEPTSDPTDCKPKFVEQSIEMVDEIKEINVHSCPNCRQMFENKRGMIIHLHHCTKSNTNKLKKRHTCTICSAAFKFQKGLQDHLNKHKGIKPYRCRKENCNNHSYTIKDRIRHEKRCGMDKPICPQCGLQLASPDTLKVHMETHGETTHPCDICGKLFKSKATHRKHRLVHTDDRDFPCTVCKKLLKSAYSLRIHMRIHTQEKPHACHLCGQGFAYKCLVKPHIKRCHMGEGCE